MTTSTMALDTSRSRTARRAPSLRNGTGRQPPAPPAAGPAPAPAPAPAPPPPRKALAPAGSTVIVRAVVVPSAALAPVTVTVWPGCRSATVPVTVLVTVDDGAKVIFTRLPVASVRYSVEPSTVVTTPTVPPTKRPVAPPPAPPAPPAAPVPPPVPARPVAPAAVVAVPVPPPPAPAAAALRAPAAFASAAEAAVGLSWCFCRAEPPQKPAAAKRRSSRSPVRPRTRRPLGGPVWTQSSSSSKYWSSGSGPAWTGRVAVPSWAYPSGRAGRGCCSVGSCGNDMGLLRSLVAQGVDGPQRRRTVGRVEAEEHPDGEGHTEGQADGVRRNHGLHPHDAEAAADEAHCDPDDAPDQREEDGFDQELDQDHTLGGADRLADADLTGALGDRHQHDVHHADAADEKGDGGDGAEQDGEGLVGRLRRLQQAALVEDDEG